MIISVLAFVAVTGTCAIRLVCPFNKEPIIAFHKEPGSTKLDGYVFLEINSRFQRLLMCSTRKRFSYYWLCISPGLISRGSYSTTR